DELNKSYVDLAKSRGLNDSELLFNHVLRNAIISIFAHSKSILWFMLSNLLLIEYVFNLAGLMRFMFDFYSPEVLTVGLLLIRSEERRVGNVCMLSCAGSEARDEES